MTAPFIDLYTLSEADRIDLIGNAAVNGAVVGFVVEDDEKADRYVKQLRERFQVHVIDRGPGPVANTVLVKVGPRGH